jgi:hypothetical protein
MHFQRHHRRLSLVLHYHQLRSHRRHRLRNRLRPMRRQHYLHQQDLRQLRQYLLQKNHQHRQNFHPKHLVHR